jgi:hypothetical protein
VSVVLLGEFSIRPFSWKAASQPSQPPSPSPSESFR